MAGATNADLALACCVSSLASPIRTFRTLAQLKTTKMQAAPAVPMGGIGVLGAGEVAQLRRIWPYSPQSVQRSSVDVWYLARQVTFWPTATRTFKHARIVEFLRANWEEVSAWPKAIQNDTSQMLPPHLPPNPQYQSGNQYADGKRCLPNRGKGTTWGDGEIAFYKSIWPRTKLGGNPNKDAWTDLKTADYMNREAGNMYQRVRLYNTGCLALFRRSRKDLVASWPKYGERAESEAVESTAPDIALNRFDEDMELGGFGPVSPMVYGAVRPVDHGFKTPGDPETLEPTPPDSGLLTPSEFDGQIELSGGDPGSQSAQETSEDSNANIQTPESEGTEPVLQESEVREGPQLGGVDERVDTHWKDGNLLAAYGSHEFDGLTGDFTPRFEPSGEDWQID